VSSVLYLSSCNNRSAFSESEVVNEDRPQISLNNLINWCVYSRFNGGQQSTDIG